MAGTYKNSTPVEVPVCLSNAEMEKKAKEAAEKKAKEKKK